MTEIASGQITRIEDIIEGLAETDYIASRQIATAILLAQNLEKPVLVEGSAGVGKTELALATAKMLNIPLIRIQCYEGLDESKALYEWKYGKQLLYTQVLKDKIGDVLQEADDLDTAMSRLHGFTDMFFSEQFFVTKNFFSANFSTK